MVDNSLGPSSSATVATDMGAGISQSGQGRGELKIGFESTEDLNRILEILEP